MPFKKLEKETYVYVVYKRGEPGDFSLYRDELERLSKEDLRDIIVDLTPGEVITEGEIGILITALKHMQGTTRQLRIVAPPAMYERFALRNLHKANNIVLYNSHHILLNSLN